MRAHGLVKQKEKVKTFCCNVFCADKTQNLEDNDEQEISVSIDNDKEAKEEESRAKRCFITFPFSKIRNLSKIQRAELYKNKNSPGFDRVKRLLIVHKSQTQGLIILFGLLYNLPHCVYVVYGAISSAKPGLFRWLEHVKSPGETPMLECAKQKGPCALRPAPQMPPCKPPPPPPFPWIYLWITGGIFSLMGLLYRLYLYYLSFQQSEENKAIWRPRRKIKRPYHEKDLPACVQYLIIGTGAAGWAGYRAIKQHDKTAKVFFITKEDILPYKRPPMSKHMWWNAEPPDLKTLTYVEGMRRLSMYYGRCKDFMDPVKFYRKKKGPALSIASGWCVIRIDPDEHCVYVQTVCGEQPIYYERLLLAPGSKPKNLSLIKSAPKFVRDRIQTLRTIRDLEKAFRKVRESKDVVILGGGLLGTELAWYLGKMNNVIERDPEELPINFTLMYKDRGILGNLLPDYLGQWAAEVIKCANVKVMPQTMVWDAFETPDGRLELTLSNGKSMVVDYMLVAIGSLPREELAEVSFLELDRINGGYKVNTEMVARKHLWVAGDAASIYSQWKDTRIRMEHVVNAEEQGNVAGSNMTGFWTPLNDEPYYQLNLGDQLNIEVIGEIGACMPTVALFKQCTDAAIAKMQKDNQDPKKVREKKDKIEKKKKLEKFRRKRKLEPYPEYECFKSSTEEERVRFKWKYKRGIVFYLRDDIVVGMMFWNIPPIEHRKEVVTELLRASPSYKEVNTLAGLVGFPQTICLEDEIPEAEKEVECRIRDGVRKNE